MAERVSLYYGTEMPDEIKNSKSGDIYYNTENKNIYIANPETSDDPAKLVPTDIGMNYDTYRMLIRDLTTLGVANACVVNKSDLSIGIDPDSLREFLYLDDRFNNSTNTIMVLPAELEVIGDGINSCFWKISTTYSNISHIVFAPNEICKINRVAPYAFKGSQFTEINLPDGITEIGNNAFESCSSLTSINLPNTVTNIGLQAFYKCKSLYYVKIPCGVRLLLNHLFKGCENLRYVVLPSTIEGIYKDAFDECDNLSEIYYEGSKEDWNEITNSDKLTGVTTFFYSESDPGTSGTYWHYNDNGGIEIWNNFVNYVFDETQDAYNVVGINEPPQLSSDPIHIVVTSMYKNKAVNKISNYAFKDESNLYSVVLPKKIYLGVGAFQNCDCLNSVTMPNTLIGNKIEDDTFKHTGIEKITIPDGVEHIGNNTFYGCSMLTNVTIPKSVTSIGSYAFYECRNIKNVYITDIEAWLNIFFSDYTSRPNQYGNLHILSEGGIEITTLTIPNSVTSIGSYALQGCRSLKSVTIPNSVTSIGYHALHGCTSLASVTFDNGVKLTTISKYAFFGCESLTSIEIPDGVTTIDNAAFSHCLSLTSITIPNSVTIIGQSAFDECGKLQNINYYGDESEYKNISINEIGNNAFIHATVHYI